MNCASCTQCPGHRNKAKQKHIHKLICINIDNFTLHQILQWNSLSCLHPEYDILGHQNPIRTDQMSCFSIPLLRCACFSLKMKKKTLDLAHQ